MVCKDCGMTLQKEEKACPLCGGKPQSGFAAQEVDVKPAKGELVLEGALQIAVDIIGEII